MSRNSSTTAQPASGDTSAAETDPPARYTNTVQLPDGRMLAWAEAGDLGGFPLLLFHGFPGSRLEARGVEDIGRRHNIRFIAPDRPGYGRSTFQPGRRIVDWPADVQYLARHLNLRRYAVLGGSGGGPFALACAATIPPETLTAVGLVCTAAPWESNVIRYVSWYRRTLSWAARYVPSLTAGFFDCLLAILKRFAASNPGKNYLDAIAVKAAATAGKVIVESEKTPEAVAARRERLLRIMLEPFAQGAKGLVQEAHLLSHPYGFRLEEVHYLPKVQIWHGSKDVNSPIQMVRAMDKRLPDSTLHEFDGETHFTVMKRLEEICAKLVEKRWKIE